MFTTVEGIQVPDLNGVQEGYMKLEKEAYCHILVNVSAEHIDDLFETLSSLVREPAFFLLEHGTNQKEEETLRKSPDAPFHKDIYYLDGQTYDSFLPLYRQYRTLLVNDGEICYGFGAHDGIDEVYVGPYKMFSILTDSPEKYEQILFAEGFRPCQNMKTVWDTFTQETPGRRCCIKHDGMDIYEMVRQLKERGLYLAERRPAP